MAKKQKGDNKSTNGGKGGNGGGSSVLQSAEAQNAIRRAAKAKRRHSAGGNRFTMSDFSTGSGVTAQREDRQASRREFAAKVTCERVDRTAFHKRNLWNEEALLFVGPYVDALLGVDEGEEATRNIEFGGGLTDNQQDTVHFHIAYVLCFIAVKYPPVGTPAQQANWFEPMCQKAKEHRARQEKQWDAKRTQDSTSEVASTVAEKVLVSA